MWQVQQTTSLMLYATDTTWIYYLERKKTQTLSSCFAVLPIPPLKKFEGTGNSFSHSHTSLSYINHHHDHMTRLVVSTSTSTSTS